MNRKTEQCPCYSNHVASRNDGIFHAYMYAKFYFDTKLTSAKKKTKNLANVSTVPVLYLTVAFSLFDLKASFEFNKNPGYPIDGNGSSENQSINQ